MLGFIFHWGLYSVPGYDSVASASRRKMQNGSEWYLKRLTENGSYRPISGWKETQDYHKQEFGENSDYYKTFIPLFEDANQDWDPEEWMKLAVKKGASYVILTTKHHDGYCLWKGSRDLVQIFCDTARKYHLKVGLYYSWSEFGKSITKNYLNTVIIPDITHLKTYKPDIWWFDGHWDIKTKIAKETISGLVKSLSGEVNDRIPDSSMSSFRNHEDRFLPEEKLDHEWESIQTIGLSWGYNRDQQSKHYKTKAELDKLQKKVHQLGGRFLINLGPLLDGSLDENEVRAILG